MGCCYQLSAKFVLVFTALLTFVGTCLLGYGLYFKVEHKEYQSLSQWMAFELWAVGLCMFLVGSTGFWGVKKKNKWLLIVHWFFAFAAMALFLAASVVYMVNVGYLKDVAEIDSEKFGDTSDDASKANAALINDFQLSIYNTCCADKTFGATEAVLCGSTNSTCNGLVDNEKCGCIVDQKIYDDYLQKVDADLICEALGELTVDYSHENGPEKEVKIVGEIAEGGCGYGNPKSFQMVLLAYFEGVIKPFVGVLYGMFVFMLLQVICLCCLICGSREDYDDEYRRKQEAKRATAGSLSGAHPASQGPKYV